MLETHDPRRFAVRFLRQFVGCVRILQCSFRMPSSRFVIPFFIVFGSRPMSLRRKFVLLGGFSVCFVHVRLLPGKDMQESGHIHAWS